MTDFFVLEPELGPVEVDLIVDEEPTVDRLTEFANTEGDISHLLDDAELTSLGNRVVDEWEGDKATNADWREKAERALKLAGQDVGEAKTYPFLNASNVKYPILTVAAQQFAARAYPAIVKGDEAVGVKLLGMDPPPPPPPPPPDAPPEVQQQAMQIVQIAQQAHQARAMKRARADRVKTWLNYRLFYGMEDWEGGVDALLHQMPIIGMAFKKVYFDPHRGCCSDYVNALHLTVPKDTKSLERCPRVTQDFELYPYEIHARMASEVYREISLTPEGDDPQEPRTILEQHRLEDLDGDGIEEPYIVTVDSETGQVLRLEAAFGPDDIARAKTNNRVTHIRRWMPFVPFPFMPDPQGGFYGLGFGQLLAPLTEVINTSINQLVDAGHAQVAGGGFIASGLRLQGSGQSSVLRFQPGEYKVVGISGAQLRDSVWEKTLPNPSPVLYQLLDLCLGAAKEIASIKDVLTGDAPATAPVGTTLALIEQGLSSFTAIYKRFYRSQKAEFKLIYDCEGRWGSPEAYMALLDDPAANLRQDFSAAGDDIVPISDPTVVTRAQALAKAQVIQQVRAGGPLGVFNDRSVAIRMLEAADVDNPEELLAPVPQGPPPPPPGAMEEIAKTVSEIRLNDAKAQGELVDAEVKSGAAREQGAMNAAYELGAALEGGMGGLEGQPRYPVGPEGPPFGGDQAEGPLGGSLLGPGPLPA